MANDNPDYLHLASNKFSITCKTCGITETFYSELSVGYFRLKHAGHELVEVNPRAAATTATVAREAPNPNNVPPSVQEAPEPPKPKPAAPSVAEAREAPSLATSLPEENPSVVRVDRVLVDTRASPLDGLPVIRVRGLREDGRTFARLFKPEEAGKMREFLGSGRFEDRDANLVYTWETDTISFEQEPPERSAPVEPKKEEARGRELVAPPPPAPPIDSVASSLEGVFPEEAPAPVPKPPPAPEPALLRTERPRRLRPPTVEEAKKPAPATPEAPPPAPAPPEKVKKVEKLEKPEKAERAEKARKNHETLLLAKSSYIQEGEESMNEALRISKILKAFRWNVEPVYTIGVIVDDNLSIETNKGEISGNLVKQIEKAGYKLSAVTASAAKPTAWFKRKPSPEVPLVDDPERTRQLELKVEELTKALQDERSGASEQKAVWEKRFLLLTNLVRSLREGGPEPGAETGDSEPQPEADVTS